MIGRRNEVARERHRNELKRIFSLTELPKSEVSLENEVKRSNCKYSLPNHFGWTIQQRAVVGDGFFFTNFCQNCNMCDVANRNCEKVTYIMCIDENESLEDKITSLKETQTSLSCMHACNESKVPLQPLDHHVYKKPKNNERKSSVDSRSARSKAKKNKRKPSKSSYSSDTDSLSKHKNKNSTCWGRSRSPSKASGDSSKDRKNNRKVKKSSNSRNPPSVSDNLDLESYLNSGKENAQSSIEKESEKQKTSIEEKVKKERKKRKGPDRWQLRAKAGADKIEKDNYDEKFKEKSSNELRTKSKLISCLARSSAKHVNKPTEYLLHSASGQNQYLYVSLRENKNQK